MAGNSDWIRSFIRCEKLMAKRIGNAVDAAPVPILAVVELITSSPAAGLHLRRRLAQGQMRLSIGWPARLNGALPAQRECGAGGGAGRDRHPVPGGRADGRGAAACPLSGGLGVGQDGIERADPLALATTEGPSWTG